jgi:Tfp pilus assembly protein PilF
MITGGPLPGARARTSTKPGAVLGPAAAAHLQAAAQAMQHNDPLRMQAHLREVLAEAPTHAEAMRLLAIAHHLRGEPAEAMSVLRRALTQDPDQPVLLNTFGTLLREAGNPDAALGVFRRVCELQPELASAWFNLGMTLQSRTELREAQSAFARAVSIAPDYALAHVGNAGALNMLGRGEEAAAAYRTALRLEPTNVHAWAGLAELKTQTLDESETRLLTEVHAQSGLNDEDRATLGFALGRTLEHHGRHAEAFAIFEAANTTMRRMTPWDAHAHARTIEAITNAFDTAPPGNPDLNCGSEVVFVVSLPRAGSTLAEQILAAHPQVEGAGELPDLATLLQAESTRRGKTLAEWAGEAGCDDWARLGRDYLARTAHWRRTRPVHADKALFNWPLVGAIRAMLPGARIVNCRRDPLETGWSIYKQRFARGQQAFAYDLGDIGAYWVGYDRLMHTWHARHPTHMHEFVHEALVAAPETHIRALLAFCGLPFDPACLRSHAAERVVRTASAAQVRQPLRGDTARAQHYGALLDPLRHALGI